MSTRANIHLDNEAYAFAYAYARGRGLALGAAISELLRQRAEQSGMPPIGESTRLRRNEVGLLVKARDGRVITSEMAKEAAEDDLD